MLSITIPAQEYFDEVNEEFVTVKKEQIIQLEHSLVSISKWESKWKKPFLDKKEKTTEETLDYIKCMTITQNIDDKSYLTLNKKQLTDISNYISDSMTATIISQKKGRGASDVVTSELIYFWMVNANIPFECQKWHLNRLLTLIQICNIKNSPPTKMKRQEILSRNRSLNEARKQQLNTKG